MAIPRDPEAKVFTVQDLADYFSRQSMLGRGQWPVQLDKRGLKELVSDGGSILLSIPPSGERVSEKASAIFLSARPGG